MRITDYLTTEQVADLLGVTTGRVRQLARKHHLGTMVGRGRLYSKTDIETMRARKTTPGPMPQEDDRDVLTPSRRQ